MRRLTLLVSLLTLILALPASAQNCTPDTILLNSQADVDNFQVNHGPCDHVVGILEVAGPDIVQLSGLSGLTSIGANFSLEGNTSLASVNLPGLATIGGGLSIENNAVLASIDLSALTSVSSLSIAEHPGLTSIDLSSLATAEDDISMFDNDLLIQLEIPQLSLVFGGLFLGSHPVLATVDLPSLERVGFGAFGGDLQLDANPSLGILNLPVLRTVNSLRLNGQTSLERLDLPALESVSVDVTVNSNDGLLSMSMPAVTSVGNQFFVSDNSALSSCCGLLPVLDPGVVQGPLNITNNAPGCSSVNEIRAACTLEIPAATPWGLGILAVLLAIAGARRMRRR